ncbi:MAG: 4Fe-4S dicluster domain-containing protein [candidate division NC10 bacterium]|nr:4Fe-4S dicluster domain-containing protein [candidate division NC10 bacterium]
MRDAYPELLRCIGCNPCTRVCPQDIPVMDLLSATFRNDFFRIADKSFDCILCGLCAARCPADIAPFNIFRYVRRLAGRHLTPASHDVAMRVEGIEAGTFEEELDRLMSAGKEELEQAFRGFQAARSGN